MSAYSSNSSLAAYRSVAVHGGVAAANPHQLVLMLLDGALDRVIAACGAIEHGSIEAKGKMLNRAMAIIDELRASLNMQQGGELAANLGDLYDYCGRLLLKANLENRTAPLEEAVKLLREIRGAWIQIAPRA